MEDIMERMCLKINLMVLGRVAAKLCFNVANPRIRSHDASPLSRPSGSPLNTQDPGR